MLFEKLLKWYTYILITLSNGIYNQNTLFFRAEVPTFFNICLCLVLKEDYSHILYQSLSENFIFEATELLVLALLGTVV